MSKLKYAWWPYVRNVIRWQEMRKRRAKLSKREKLEIEIVKNAIRDTLQLPDGEERYELMKKVYWARNRVTLQRAAADLLISYATARRWQHDLYLVVAEKMGLYDPKEDA